MNDNPGSGSGYVIITLVINEVTGATRTARSNAIYVSGIHNTWRVGGSGLAHAIIPSSGTDATPYSVEFAITNIDTDQRTYTNLLFQTVRVYFSLATGQYSPWMFIREI